MQYGLTRIAFSLALALAAIGANAALAADAKPRPEIVIGTPSIRPTHGGLDTSNYAQPVVYNVFDRMIERDFLSEDVSLAGAIRPGLVTAWRQIDPVTWELKVRRGVTFHDGSPMTAEDVAFTVSPERAKMRPNSFVDTIASAEAVDAETVRVVTKGPDPILLWRLSSPVGNVVPKKAYTELGWQRFAAAPVGTGPYRFVEKIDGDRVVLEPNDNYWGSRPPLGRITFREVPEVSTRIANLIAGQIDMAMSIPPDLAPLIEREQRLKTRASKIMNVQQLVFNGADPANVVHDKRIRQAMMLAMPRPLIAERLWNGLTDVPDGYNWDEFGAMKATNPTPAYDPARAKALIAEAGYNGRPIVVRFVNGYYVNMNRALQVSLEAWKAVGLNIDLQVKENWTQIEQNDRTDFDAYAVSADLDFNDPISPMWTRWNRETGSYALKRKNSQYGSWVVPDEYMALGRVLSTSLDPAERKSAWQKMHDILMDEVPHLPLYRPVEIWGMRADIDWSPYPLYWMDFRAENITIGGSN